MCLYLWIGGYYSGDLEFTTDVDKLLDFKEDDAMFVPVRIQQILQDNKRFIQLEKTDSSLAVYYDGHFIIYLPNTLTCKSISEHRRDLVRMYDEKETFIWEEETVNLFREEIIQIYKKYHNEKYEAVLFPKDTIYYMAASERPLIVAYQYDKEKGLSIHKICSIEHTLIENPYTEDLAELAKKYCTEYHLSKILFAARVYIKED
jgi:hypothetical protein